MQNRTVKITVRSSALFFPQHIRHAAEIDSVKLAENTADQPRDAGLFALEDGDGLFARVGVRLPVKLHELFLALLWVVPAPVRASFIREPILFAMAGSSVLIIKIRCFPRRNTSQQSPPCPPGRSCRAGS